MVNKAEISRRQFMEGAVLASAGLLAPGIPTVEPSHAEGPTAAAGNNGGLALLENELLRIEVNSKSGDITSTGKIWVYDKVGRSMSTVSIYDGLLYIADYAGYVHCLDAETGQPCWVHQTNGDIWGSTLAADGKVFVGTRRGDFWILASGREKKVLGMTEMGAAISSTPVAANGTLYIATATQLFAVKKAE
jgi:outer membrane protein assembly factor BamB